MTYTKEQIIEAINSVNAESKNINYTHPSDVIAELTKPASVFKVGEIVIQKVSGESVIWRDSYTTSHYRRPSPEEVPALKLAIDGFLLLKRSGLDEHGLGIVNSALDDIKAML